MSQLIKLSQNRTALVDDEDFETLNKYSWRVTFNQGRYYAVRGTARNKVYMHRQILSAPIGVKVDHVDRKNTLDNRRSNLRLATDTQNAVNCTRKVSELSGYRGVQHRPYRPNWPYSAHISCQNRTMFLGTFKTAEEAARAYDKKAFELHGEFAVLNFPLVIV